VSDKPLPKDFGFMCVITPPEGVALPEWVPEDHRTTGQQKLPGWYAFTHAYVGGFFGWAPMVKGPFADEVACRAWCAAENAARAAPEPVVVVGDPRE
jgi:hypothetical protein